MIKKKIIIFKNVNFKSITNTNFHKFSTIISSTLLSVSEKKALLIYEKLINYDVFKNNAPLLYIDYTNLNGRYGKILNIVEKFNNNPSDLFFLQLMKSYVNYYITGIGLSVLDIKKPKEFETFHIVLRGRFYGYCILKNARLDSNLKKEITKILFDHSSIQIWEENFAEVKRYIDNLKREGVKYFEAYFNENPEKLQEIASLVKINSVNKKTLEFYNVSSMDELKLSLPSWFVESSWSVFKDEIVALANNKDRFEGEITVQTGNGELKHLFLSLSVPPSNIKDLKRVIISFVDITDRKNAEENLEAKVLERTAQLEEANRDLEELNEVFMNRELRVMELREEVERLKNKLNNIHY